MSNDDLIELLRDEQNRRCCYGTRDGDGRTCDCKFGAPTFGTRGEMTGCPELRTAIWLLASDRHHARDIKATEPDPQPETARTENEETPDA